MNACVYVLVREKKRRRGPRPPALARILHICHSPLAATFLAQSVRDVFGVPAWVADLHAPADRLHQAAQERIRERGLS